MNKILRYSLLCAMGFLFGNSFAQEVTFDFTDEANLWNLPTEQLKETGTFTKDGYTITITTTNYTRWFTDTKTLLVGEQGATVVLPKFDFDVERIDVVGTSGASVAVKQNIFVGDEAVSEETTGAKDVTNQYKIAEGKQAAGTVYTLKVTSNHNTQISKILIWKKGTASNDETGGENNNPSSTADNPMTVANAQALLANLAANVKSDEVYVKGKISKIDQVDPSYGNATFYISDNGQEDGQLEVFRAYFLEKAKFTSAEQIKVGDEVIICGQLVNYRSSKAAETDPVTPEFTSGCYIYSLNGKTKEDSGTDTPEVKEIGVAEALSIINALENGKTTTEEYLVRGKVVSISEISTQYGNATFVIADNMTDDATKQVTVFRAKGFNNEKITDENIIKVGDVVVVRGKLQKYVKNDVVTPEVSSCYISNAYTEEQEAGLVWDFTKWSEATIANLKADAAASADDGWSDVEKDDGSNPTEGKCFWAKNAGLSADGEIMANGVVIEELKGLKFDAEAVAKRSLAIAVNYPETSLGTYNGPQYLWLGSKNINYFTIPAVAAGSTITMEMESHKSTDARGVQLKQNDMAIGDAFTPTTFASYTWTIENAGDVVVSNTNGCHIYKITVASASNVQAVKTIVVDNGYFYNLAGQRVDANYKGVVIKNGKKMIQK